MFQLTVPQAPETQTPHDAVWEGTVRRSTELAASPSSTHPQMASIGCCPQFQFLPIKTPLVALGCSLGNTCVCFSHPPPRASDSDSLRLPQNSCFLSSMGWLGFWYPCSWPATSNLGLRGYLPFEELDWGLNVQPVLLTTSTSLVFCEASSDLLHHYPCPHHHCGHDPPYPDGGYSKWFCWLMNQALFKGPPLDTLTPRDMFDSLS